MPHVTLGSGKSQNLAMLQNMITSLHLSVSGFSQQQWASDCTYPVKKRCVMIVADLYRQLVPFLSAYAMATVFSTKEERIRFAVLGAACFLSSAVGHVLFHVFHHHSIERKNDGDVSSSQFFKQAEHIAYVVSQLFMSVFYVATVSRVVNEFAKAIMAQMLLENQNPEIKMGLWEQSTSIQIKELTPLGEQIGWKYVLALLNAAGPLARHFILDYSLIRLAETVYKNNEGEKGDPPLAMQAYMRVFLSTLMTVREALSAVYRPDNNQNIFVNLKTVLDFHPFFSAFVSLFLPIFFDKIGVQIPNAFYQKYGTRHGAA